MNILGRMSDKRTIIISGAIGNVMEWYDFALFGYFAPVISELFFPGEVPMHSLIATFAVFAVGFFMRPLGGLLFGHIGDRRGRKITLLLSIALMTMATCGLGLVPTYGQIGLVGVVLLVALRLFQGLSVGGEFSASVTYVVEEAPSNRRGTFGSVANVGSMIGMASGALAAALTTSLLSSATVHSWGWRIPFLFAGVIGIVAMYMRRSLPESYVFKHESRHQDASPLRKVFHENRGEFMQSLAFTTGYAVLFYIPLVYLPTYVNRFLGMDLGGSLQFTTIVSASLVGLIVLMGYLSDTRIIRKRLLMVSFVLAVVLSLPLFWLLLQGQMLSTLVVLAAYGILVSIPLGVAPSTITELYPTDDRLTGYSISYNIGLGIIGGSTPMIATTLIRLTNNLYVPALYIIVTSSVSLAGLYFMKDRSREPLR
ncbi:MFS transporter [archaeon]|nr:MAG: MFS transporter [archaeon]